jgi:chaperonin cofactor prefoldin
MKAEIEALAASLERQIDRMEVRVDELRRTAFRIRTRLREPLERSQRVIMKGRLETLEARIAELRSAVERTRRHLARIDSVLAVPGAARP